MDVMRRCRHVEIKDSGDYVKACTRLEVDWNLEGSCQPAEEDLAELCLLTCVCIDSADSWAIGFNSRTFGTRNEPRMKENTNLFDFSSSISSAYMRILRFVGGGATVWGDDDSNTASSASLSIASSSSSSSSEIQLRTN